MLVETQKKNSQAMTSTSGRLPSEPSLQLLHAAIEGDAALVETLLGRELGLPHEESLDVNVQGDGKMTPLHLAAEGNHQRVLALLLRSKNIDVNAQDELGRTAIVIAAERGLTTVTQMLQEARANVLLCAQGGCTALHVAAWHGHSEVVDLLLGMVEPRDIGNEELVSPQGNLRKLAEDVNNVDLSVSQETNRRLCRRLGKYGDVRSLLSRQLKSSRNDCPEYHGYGDCGLPEEILRFQPCKTDVLRLLEAKTSAEQFTPLHLAASNGHCQVAESLIQAYGQAVGITDVLAHVREKGGQEALNLVINSIIRILNSCGDNYSSNDVKADVVDRALGKWFQGYDISPFSWSSIDAMVSYVNEKDCIGRTPLHHATWEQHLGMTEKLLEVFIVNVNATDLDGFAPLHLSSYKGCQAAVELLIANDSKLQMLNPNLAARQNKSTRGKIVEVKRVQQRLGSILLAKNLQDFIFVEERDGMTPLHYAVERGNEAIVAALAGRSDIDVFAMARPGTKPSVMEALAPGGGEEKSQTPLTMAFSANNSDILHNLLKSGKRNKFMQEIQMLRGYFSKSPKSEDNRKNVKEYHRKMLMTAVTMIKLDLKILQSDLFLDLERELAVILNTLLHKPNSNEFTLLHHSAFAGLSLDLELLLSIPDIASDINAGDVDNQTALHFATMEGETAAVKVLVNDMALRPNEDDVNNRSALQIATEKGWRDIVSLLMGCPDVKLEMKKLYRDRGVNDNAANAILVVAALIASVTFAGWLQPPLGLRPYYDVKPIHGEPPGTVDTFAAVQQYDSVLCFWIFNNLSFFFAMSTVISGIAEVLPMRDAFIGQEVRMVRGGLVRSSVLLVLSIICVLVAFGGAGFASLPPIKKYRSIMWWTTLWGASVCSSMLLIFWTRMGSMLVTDSRDHKVKWWRWRQADVTVAGPIGWSVWLLANLCHFIPEAYARFESRRPEGSYKRKLFWRVMKLFKLDREEFWRYNVN